MAAEDAVELATFHRAKGLEWATVCVVGPRGRLRAHRLRRCRRRREPKSAGSSTWPSPGPPASSTVRGRALRRTGDRPADESATPHRGWPPWPVCRGPGMGRPAPGQAGRRIAELRGRPPALSASSQPAPRFSRQLRSPTSMSTNTGAWSEGFSPLRALRSMSP